MFALIALESLPPLLPLVMLPPKLVTSVIAAHTDRKLSRGHLRIKIWVASS
jgi:hypothetical protein